MSSDSPEVDSAQLLAETATVAQPEKPSQRMLIGSQRDRDSATEAKANPVTPAAPLARPPTEQFSAENPSPGKSSTSGRPRRRKAKHYPPPNIRDQLSPELEAEYRRPSAKCRLNRYEGFRGRRSGDRLLPEARVTGRVAKIHRDDVFVDLAGDDQGVVPLRQFETPPAKARARVAGRPVQRRRRALRTVAPDRGGQRRQLGRGQRRQGRRSPASRANKGGLECEVPAFAASFPSARCRFIGSKTWRKCVGQKLASSSPKPIPTRRNLVLSRRAVLEREKARAKDKLRTELEVGQVREGGAQPARVRRVCRSGRRRWA